MDIKVLGTGCANCRNTIALIDQVAKAKGVAVQLEKVEELRDIMGYGVMSTPGVVIDGKVVHAGGVPSRDKIEHWLAQGASTKPVLHALAQDPRIAVADVDILKERGYIGRYQIRLMPTQVFYNAKGEETGRHMGKISGEEILARLGLASSNAATGDALPKAAL
jgi:small redox-active disulfide protein 2